MSIDISYNGKYEGEWWIPGREENTIQGTLEVGDGGMMYLQTMGQINAKASWLDYENIDYLEGVGWSEKHNKSFSIGIFNLLEVNKIVGNVTRSRFLVHKALIGDKSKRIEGSFSEIMLGSEAFSNWVKETGLNRKAKFENDKIKGSSIEYSQPEPIDLFNLANTKGYIFFRWSHNMKAHRNLSMAEQPFLNLTLVNKVSLKDLLGEIRILELFFMVLWEQYHIFTDVDVRNENKGVYRFIGSRHVQKAPSVNGFDYNNFIANAEKYIGNWIKIYEDFDLAIRTFFFAFADYKVDIHSRFLNYVFALEQLHRKGFKATESLSKKDKRMYEKAMQIKQGDLKSWLEMVLNKESNISIKTRLQELCEFSELKESEKISNDELIRINNMRHYLVHLDEKRKKTAFTAREVYEINQKLESLFFTVLKKSMVEEKPWPAFS